MKTKSVLSPQIEHGTEEYQEVVATYELPRTVVPITVCTYQGRHVAHTLRKGSCQLLKNARAAGDVRSPEKTSS